VTTTKCRRVLVVDDNLGLAENLAELVELRGHSAVVATSAEAALAEASAHPPDVLVTDYRLPGMSGAGLVRRLREAGIHAVAIVISAFTDDETIDDASPWLWKNWPAWSTARAARSASFVRPTRGARRECAKVGRAAAKARWHRRCSPWSHGPKDLRT
jgi:CheY-like chemotaxis protein